MTSVGSGERSSGVDSLRSVSWLKNTDVILLTDPIDSKGLNESNLLPLCVLSRIR